MTHQSRRSDAKLLAKVLLKGGVASIPVAGSAAVEVLNGLERRKDNRAIETLEAVILGLNIEFSRVVQKLSDDEGLAELWQRAISAVRSSRLQSKRNAFAAIMQGAVEAKPQQRTVANVLIRLIDQLEEEHLELIEAISRLAKLPPELDPSGNEGKPGATVDRLQQDVPHLTLVLEILLSSLLSFNVISDSWKNTYGGLAGQSAYVLTNTGNAIMQTLSGGERLSFSDD
ncbi:hypothetical protein [Actinokineospora sp. HUAS TT18]|uniref:hypothetical protein n=1 Tax=Actinokineospora sp. HUAS TT18 TaxID=3447451 RepID=UPI003F5271F8